MNSVLFPDTRPEAEKVLIDLLRQAPPWWKLEMVGQMNAAVKTMMLSGLGEVSDRQWCDILGVLKVQKGRLDLDTANTPHSERSLLITAKAVIIYL